MSDHFKKKKVKRSRGSMSRVSNVDSDPTMLSAFDMCLSALKVSVEKRDTKCMIPPTPLGSPIHSRVMKRARFGSCSNDDECEAAGLAIDATGSALVILSSHLENELDILQKREWKRTKKAQQQLGFYAINTAFHRAFAERNSTQVCSAFD